MLQIHFVTALGDDTSPAEKQSVQHDDLRLATIAARAWWQAGVAVRETRNGCKPILGYRILDDGGQLPALPSRLALLRVAPGCCIASNPARREALTLHLKGVL